MHVHIIQSIRYRPQPPTALPSAQTVTLSCVPVATTGTQWTPNVMGPKAMKMKANFTRNVRIANALQQKKADAAG